MAAEQLYKVAYDEAVRALAEQREALDSLRSRTGLLLSAAAITTSFLGAQALQSGNVNSFAWLALVGFVGVAAVSLVILWPRRWESMVNPHDMIATYIESAEPVSIEKLHRELSIHMNGSYLDNRDGFRKLVVFFQTASVLLAVEVGLWIVAIAMI